MTVQTVYVIPLSKPGEKVEICMIDADNVSISIVHPSIVTLTATVSLEEFLDIASEIEMKGKPE
jgi:hypothetical protein